MLLKPEARGAKIGKQIIRPDKSRGQHFLIDKNVLAKIIAAADLSKKDTVIEIGAGTGVLTAELAKRAGKVAAFEIDKKLVPVLKENVREYKNVEIRNEDVLNSELLLKFKNSEFIIHSSKFKLIANLPYNITSAVLEKFLSAENKPTLIVLLVQKEVAERICARPGETSVLSVMVRYYGRPEIVAAVPSSAFWPQPKIDSAILKIKIRRSEDYKIRVDEKFFFQVVKSGFSRRRKMLKNTLKSFPPTGDHPKGENVKFVKNEKQCNNVTMKQCRLESRRLAEDRIVEILKEIGLPPTVRAQELGVEDWRKLASLLYPFVV